jgi:hypothetical protein
MPGRVGVGLRMAAVTTMAPAAGAARIPVVIVFLS